MNGSKGSTGRTWHEHHRGSRRFQKVSSASGCRGGLFLTALSLSRSIICFISSFSLNRCLTSLHVPSQTCEEHANSTQENRSKASKSVLRRRTLDMGNPLLPAPLSGPIKHIGSVVSSVSGSETPAAMQTGRPASAEVSRSLCLWILQSEAALDTFAGSKASVEI